MIAMESAIGGRCTVLPTTESAFRTRIPMEIRNLNHVNVFGPSIIHIVALENRIAHVTCQHWQSNESWMDTYIAIRDLRH